MRLCKVCSEMTEFNYSYVMTSTNCSGINNKRFTPPKQNIYKTVYNAHFDRCGGTQKPANGASQDENVAEITHNLAPDAPQE